MRKRKSKLCREENKTPRVRIAQPSNRPIQLRYNCPVERREVRISTGTLDLAEAQSQKKRLEAKLLLGIKATVKEKHLDGPQMPWDDFRETYRELQLSTINDESAAHAESRLDIAGRVLSPRTLIDIANPNALHRLQAELLNGKQSRFGRPRSPHTVKSYMTSVLAAINWAHLQGWLEKPPKIRKVKVAKLSKMKGRALTCAEFERLKEATATVVGEAASSSWIHLLRALWESAFRLNELMHLSWDDPSMIRPEWVDGRFPVLHIPHARQKNATDEEIPLIPGFERLLLETPAAQRTGWVVNPQPLNAKMTADPNSRLTTERVGKIVSAIGKAAEIEVVPKNDTTGRPAKFASAHDLRRSCAQRMLDAGLQPILISRILRHASWETTQKHYASGNIQSDAKRIRKVLS